MPGQLHFHLYDLAPHFAPDSFYFPVVADTSNSLNFFYLYEAMFYCAKDTNTMMNVDTLVKRSLAFQGDTMPILLINYSFLQIEDTALKVPGYFMLDTLNNQVLNHPSPIGSPYIEREIFAAGLPEDESYFNSVIYRIDPDLMLFGPLEHYKKNNAEGIILKIDFGDGNGWISFNQAVTTHHSVVYPQEGSYAIQVAIFYGSDPNPINYSIFKTSILTNEPSVQPDFTISHPAGYRAGFFAGCTKGDQPEEDMKFVIYLEGFDVHDFLPKKNRTIANMYSEMIKRSEIVELRNFGYTFVIVDWHNSRRDIRDNAMALVHLIDYLKCQYPTSDHEFVVIGESMGGLVARYALTFMETDDYQSGYAINLTTPFYPATPELLLSTEPCLPELMHKTRLLMTFDTPHQGANIPLAYQELYKLVADGLFGGIKFISPILRYLVTDAASLYLGSKSAQQMLIYHADAKEGLSTLDDEWYYYPHPAKANFFDDLARIGNYPRFCKKMALSNGSITGNRQTRPYNGVTRNVNDVLFQFNGDIYTRIFHFIRIPVFGMNLDLRSNPDGYGKVLGANAGTWGVRIKLYWFGIKVNVGLNSHVYRDIWAGNTNPWCTEAGGFIPIKIYPGATAADTKSKWGWYFLLGLNWKSHSDGNGYYSFDTKLGIPFVAQTGSAFDMYFDGVHFNFIPTASALDWGNLNSNSPISPDIEDEDWPELMSSTPFDVIGGIGFNNQLEYPSPDKAYNDNRSHMNVENPRI